MKKILVIVAVLICALPCAAIVTFLLTPFWRWFEAKTSFESIGHSGPAPWCFGVIYAMFVGAAIGTLLWNWIRRSKSAAQS